jgi:hypothetical protein
MHRPSLADGRTGGNELLKKARAPHVGCLDVSSDSIQIFCNEISRRIIGLDFFASAQDLKSNIGDMFSRL